MRNSQNSKKGEALDISTLLNMYAYCFNEGDRSRGATYFWNDKVLSLTPHNNTVTAVVAGSHGTYQATLTINPGEVDPNTDLYCECRRFADGYNCKHLWALLLSLDETAIFTRPSAQAGPDKGSTPPLWQNYLTDLERLRRQDFAAENATARPRETRERRFFYVLELNQMTRRYDSTAPLEIHLYQQQKTQTDKWGKIKPLAVNSENAGNTGSATDQAFFRRLVGYQAPQASYSYYSTPSFQKLTISELWEPEIFNLLEATGNLYWSATQPKKIEDLSPVTIRVDEPLHIAAEVTTSSESNADVLNFFLRSASEKVRPNVHQLLAANGFALVDGLLVAIENPELVDPYLAFLNYDAEFQVRESERNDFVAGLLKTQILSAVALPDSWSIRHKEIDPVGQVILSNSSPNKLDVKVQMNYGSASVTAGSDSNELFDAGNKTVTRRNLKAEGHLLADLAFFPLTRAHKYFSDDADFTLHAKHFERFTSTLAEAGWVVLWEGQPLRSGGQVSVTVTSGVDWFELEATVAFGDESVALPQLLEAVEKNQSYVTLADGSRGAFDKQHISKYAKLAQFGERNKDMLRFEPTQVMVLDALLQTHEQEHINVDAAFTKIRKKLAGFDGIAPLDPPKGFQGTLREYQREGLSWINFLADFGFGGCLADDMGLGKTVQVLARLEARRTRRVGKQEAVERTNHEQTLQGSSALLQLAASLKRKPSLVVVPKSLIFNWIEEAKRFAPKLAILDYTGRDRKLHAEETTTFDLMVTTYGTLRKDIADISQIRFDYAILDESQAIKNATAQTTKACRLLQADHRLAMTGTPIENSLGDLWSLFDFLNPGMLGKSTHFKKLVKSSNDEEEKDETLRSLNNALQPFMLRRTKEQVLTDLPAKTEQHLVCEMLPAQQKHYNQLKKYYQTSLKAKIETDGLAQSKIHVLEALLRLRQAACDPRIIDATAKPGAKLEVLAQQIESVVAEKHKVLVFSQFTFLLALAKQDLDERQIAYEYLDGKTRNREKRVKNFQESPDISVFLISLKAGGSGLNLTAASYVYMLDPWWNPAVEAQAIDRAHRIGQQNPVMAYKLICKDTIEEKITEIQARKKSLSDAIISNDNSIMKSLTADDLQFLLA